MAKNYIAESLLPLLYAAVEGKIDEQAHLHGRELGEKLKAQVTSTETPWDDEAVEKVGTFLSSFLDGLQGAPGDEPIAA